MLTTKKDVPAIHWRRLLLSVILVVALTLLIRGERVDAPGAGVLAAILVVISAAMLIRAAVKTGSYINGSTLVLGTFLLTYPLSALVHLTGNDYTSLGFYEIAALDPHTQIHHVYLSLALVFLAQLALWFGLTPGHPQTPLAGIHLVHVRSKLLVLAGTFFTLVGVAGTCKLFLSSGELVEDVATIDRARQLSEGTARYVFMSTWLSWGIIFLLTAFIISRFSKSHPRITLAALVGGSACMFLNLFWTGSRAENLLAVLPLFLVVKKIAPHHFRPFALLITVGIVGIIVFETIARTATMLNGGLNLLLQGGTTPSQFVANQLAAVFDWQMGRYPTISLSFDMVNRYGHALGSTLFQGIAMTLNAPATLLHIPLRVPEPEAMTALVGQYIYQDPSINGVVPGTLAEFYFNFGTLGVIAGFFAIGRITKAFISMTFCALNIGTLLFGFYVITLLCLWAIPMTATISLYLLATRGLPIIAFVAIEQTLSRSASLTPEALVQAQPA